jgi:predicted phosphodiesterase
MKGEKFIVVSDSHGDMLDERVAAAFFRFLKDWSPSIRVHAGDCWDLRNLRKGASDDEKAASLEDDWRMGFEFLNRLFTGGKRNYFLRGNHDERLWRCSESAKGLLRDYAHDGIKRVEAAMKRHGATMLPYDSRLGVLKLGRLSVVHGYHTGLSASRMHALVYGNVLYGHTHTIEASPIPRLEPVEGRGIGCLCRQDMDYVAGSTGKLRWGQGWAYGTIFPDGTYEVFQAREIGGYFRCPAEIREY